MNIYRENKNNLNKLSKVNNLEKDITIYTDNITSNINGFIILQSKGDLHKVLIRDIYYLEVIQKRILIHAKHRVYKIRGNLRDLDDKLRNYSFFRCHKSYIINLSHIESIKGCNTVINNELIPISKNKVSILKSKLTDVADIIL